jgi:CcmD family protein
MNYLIAAYIATWVIHGTYLVILVRKYSKIQREMKNLKKVASH